MNNSVLVISDLHIPYHHQDAFDFLKALKRKYKPDLVVNIGDELDHHAISMHEHNPDLMSAGDELKHSKEYIRELEKIFPEMTLVHSNHSSLVYRRALKYGLPKDYLKSYNEFLGVGKGWKWVDDLTITLSDGQRCFFTHGMSADVLKVAQQYGMSTVQGHVQDRAISFARRADGKQMIGIFAGIFYQHEENYLTPHNNLSWRGVWMLHEVNDGSGDVMMVSLDYLRNKYQGK